MFTMFGRVYPPWSILLINSLIFSHSLTLDLLSCIFLLSFYHVLLLRKSTKTPGTRKKQSDGSLLTSRIRHSSVEPPLPLQPLRLLQGAAGLLQLATRHSERLTSSQTGLALFPKNNQVQDVEFNGAGYHWNYRC